MRKSPGFIAVTACLIAGIVFFTGKLTANPNGIYQGTWRGVDCTVSITQNGLTNVTGTISLPASGKSFKFSGSLNQDAMTMIVPGDPPYNFIRTFDKNKESWQLVPGGEVMFFRYVNAGGGSGLPGSGAGSGLPGSGLPGSGLPGSGLPGSGGAAPGGVMPKAAPPDPATTTYSGFWAGFPISIDIHWDNFSGQGPVEGTILYDARRVPFTGTNPSKGYMEMNISGSGGTYILNKTGTGGNLKWEGRSGNTSLVFGKSINTGVPNPGAGTPNNQAIPNGGPLWLIACEAERSQSVAESRAKAWRARGFSGTGIIHLSQYSSLGGSDQNFWLVYPVSGTKAFAKSQLSRVKSIYREAYGIKADQSGRRETFQ